MSKRPKNQKAERQKVGRVPRVTSRVLNKADTDDPWIAQTNEHINQFNEFASLLPTKYGWRFRTKAAFEEELREIAAVDSSPGNLNKLYWEDALKNLEAYTVMSAWRTSELLKNAVSLLSGGETIASAIIARAAIESVAQFLDVTRKVSAASSGCNAKAFRYFVETPKILNSMIWRNFEPKRFINLL